MSEPELAFESGLEGWIRFKHSDLRGKNLSSKKNKSFYGLHDFMATYVHVPYKTLRSFGVESETDL